MMINRTFLAGGRLLVLAALLFLSAGAAASAEARFPSVTAENLEGRKFSLPRDFAGRYAILAVAWKRSQQRDVDSWVPHLTAIETADGRVRWYELPVISRLIGTFMGPIIDRGMRRGIPSIDKRRRGITIYIDQAYFRRALALPDSDGAIHLLLIDKAGRVLWRADGPFTPVKGEALRARLKALE